jgi:uncharacterized protein YybS (DUF2232 family)
MDELSRMLASWIQEMKRLETEQRVFSRMLQVSSTDIDQALDASGRSLTLLLPSLFALKWIAVIAINCWLASVLFQGEEGAFPAFSEFSEWRLHPVAAWVLALALLLMVTRWKPAFEAGVNLILPLLLAYTVQGFAVSRYVAHAFHIRGLVQAAVLVLLALMPILVTTMTMIGLLDVWYDFRLRATPDPNAPFGGGRGPLD